VSSQVDQCAAEQAMDKAIYVACHSLSIVSAVGDGCVAEPPHVDCDDHSRASEHRHHVSPSEPSLGPAVD
jgi:hypothetical protein